MKHELRIIETSTGKHMATVSASHEAQVLVNIANMSSKALNKNFHYEILNIETLEATLVYGMAAKKVIHWRCVNISGKLRNLVEIWSPTKWIVTMGAGEMDPQSVRKIYKNYVHMLNNEAVFRVYDVERCKYLKKIKK